MSTAALQLAEKLRRAGLVLMLLRRLHPHPVTTSDVCLLDDSVKRQTWRSTLDWLAAEGDVIALTHAEAWPLQPISHDGRATYWKLGDASIEWLPVVERAETWTMIDPYDGGVS